VRRDDKSGVVNSAPGSRELAPPVSELVRHYFALDHPLDEICASFPRDPAMNAARDFCRGLRIIRQPKWECLATFICSSMKQVAHIRQISRTLRQRFGERKEICGHEVFSFPSPQGLERASEIELQKCGLGYRAKNLLATAKRVASREAALESWSALPDGELGEQLCHLPGVGAKVANCVMLFGYERIKAFPIDVWIERVLREKYFPKETKSDQREPSRIRCQLFRWARRLCAAVFISSCEDDGEESTESMIAEFVVVEAGVPPAIG
jgi:3-methyladenine DNA glycosylase/8-oxoguanine DNA glycosylase